MSVFLTTGDDYPLRVVFKKVASRRDINTGTARQRQNKGPRRPVNRLEGEVSPFISNSQISLIRTAVLNSTDYFKSNNIAVRNGYLQSHPGAAARPARFDVVAIDGGLGEDRVEWIRDAFGVEA